MEGLKMKKELEEEFDFFEIDVNKLDEEWIHQPKLFFDFSAQLVDAKKAQRESLSNLNVVKARLDSKIRKNPKKYKVEKITEAAIAYTIETCSKYKAAQELVNEKTYRVQILQAAVSALEHRRKALERLVSLHGQNYFSIPKPLDEPSKNITDKIEKRAARKRKKRRK
jgi:hypothetical protein